MVFHHFYFSNQKNNEIRLIYPEGDPEHNLILKYRNHTDFGFVLQNFAFDLLIRKILPPNILRILTALLLERKVLLIHANYQQNAVIMQSFITLLSPLYFLFLLYFFSKWNFINISYMTPELCGSLDAPVPYFIGISPDTWKQVF